jgi:hypothetical protein
MKFKICRTILDSDERLETSMLPQAIYSTRTSRSRNAQLTYICVQPIADYQCIGSLPGKSRVNTADDRIGCVRATDEYGARRNVGRMEHGRRSSTQPDPVMTTAAPARQLQTMKRVVQMV